MKLIQYTKIHEKGKYEKRKIKKRRQIPLIHKIYWKILAVNG